jgi:hypothetical protein
VSLRLLANPDMIVDITSGHHIRNEIEPTQLLLQASVLSPHKLPPVVKRAMKLVKTVAITVQISPIT